MAIVYRRPRAEELQRVQEHIARSINDLSRRHGFGAPATARQAAFQEMSYADDPEGFCVAFDGEDLVGSSFGWACGDLWFLAELFIAPERQAGGVGGELLRRALAHADKRGAGVRALITFAYNNVSQGLYTRHGLYPRLPLLMFGADREAIPAGSDLSGLTLERITASAAPLDLLAALDGSALGVARTKHHVFLLQESGMQAFLVRERGDCVGYVYVSATGHVGPMAVVRRDLTGPALAAALAFAAKGESARVSAFVPGGAEGALAVATERRMRIVLPFVLASNRVFGDWGRYLPRNPGFM